MRGPAHSGALKRLLPKAASRRWAQGRCVRAIDHLRFLSPAGLALHIEWKGLDWNGLVPRRLWGDAIAMAAGVLAAWFWRRSTAG